MSTLWPQRETQRTRNEVRWMQQLVQTATNVEQFEHPVGRGQVSTTTRWQVEGLTKVAAKSGQTTTQNIQRQQPVQHKATHQVSTNKIAQRAGQA